MMEYPPLLEQISEKLKAHSAKVILIGGCVRDHILGHPTKDYDVEIYGVANFEQLQTLLEEFGELNVIGKSFGVVKLQKDGFDYDFSLPRKERKTGDKHTDFAIETFSHLAHEEAFSRRDFTINAIGYDIEAKEYIDPFNGREDLSQKILKHICKDTFVEDPLRVYRAVQFVARFELTINPQTKELCKMMVAQDMLDFLPKERIYEEFKKLLLLSQKPSIGFEFMQEFGILRYFPELQALVGLPQDPKWHPEGDVWRHTMMCIDEMSTFKTGVTKKDEILMFAALCHDLGKATHTQITKEKISAIGHEEAGIVPMYSLLNRLTNDKELPASIEPLIRYHLAPSQFYKNGAKDKAIKKLATKVHIEDLLTLARADFFARTTPEALKREYKAGDWLEIKAKELKVLEAALAPLLKGKDLIDLGLTPSKEFAKLLKKAYEAQLEDKFTTHTQAIKWAKTNLL
ncbi:MAG: HD domain-containing protein [Campylobacterales bacterium]|nr:HD domain-containing protein [Campylobacterales bacterium]